MNVLKEVPSRSLIYLTLLSVLGLTQSLIHAQNHNPEFKVSDTFIASGSSYIFIGDDDGAAYDLRTPVELRYRDPSNIPTSGKTTLEWTSGGSNVNAYDSTSDAEGFKDGDDPDTPNESGPWEWSGQTQSQYQGNTIYLQGKVGAGTSTSPTLKSSHSENTQGPDFQLGFTMVDVDLEVTDPSGTAVSEDDETEPGTPIADPDEDGTLNTSLTAKAISPSSVGGEYRLSFSEEISVFSDSDGSTSVTLTEDSGDYVTDRFSASSDTIYYVAAPSDFSGVIDVKLQWFESSEDTSPAIDEADAVSLLKMDVRVPKIKWANDKNEVQADEFVSESILRDEGAFVPLNDDDDNYSGTADMNDMGEGTELVAIEGPGGELAETDLLPLIIKPIDGLADSGAKFLLDIPSGIRIWHEENRSDRFRGKNDPGDGEPTEIDATEETMLYIEGVQQGEVEMKFDLKFTEQTFEEIYTLKVTVFDIQGPTSVPALGTYEYRIEGIANGGQWKDPVRGMLYPSEDEAENKREIEWEHDLGWNGKTGAVIYAPIAELEWGREVDIVELKLAANAHDGENEAKGKNVLSGDGFVGIDWDDLDGVPPENNDTAVIKSGGGPHAFRGWVQVNSLRGPTRAGIENRGVDRLKYGFVQKAKWVTKRAIYPEGERRVSALEGMGWHLDRFYAEDELWIEDETYELGNGLDNRRSLFQQDENTELTNGELVFHYEFRRGSTLDNSGSRLGIMISDQYLQGNDKPSGFQVEGFFDLYITVATVSGDEKADDRYYQLANQIEPWRYAAFGRITSDEIHPPDSSISDGRNPEDLWGGYSAYAIFAISVKDGGLNNGLRPIADFDEEPFVAQEYPYLMGGQDQHEQWNNQ